MSNRYRDAQQNEAAKPVPRTRRHSRFKLWVVVLAGVLATALGGVKVSTARADLTVDKLKDVAGVISSAFGYYGTAVKVLSLLTGEGPSMADLLQNVQQAIVDEIQYWVALELDATATTSFKKYTDILDNPNQTVTNRERVLYLTGSSSSNDAGDLFAEMERLMSESRNHGLSYQLSSPFNTLAVSMGHAYKFHDKFFPEEAPYAWKTYDDHFKRVMATDYTLVGALAAQCLDASMTFSGLYQQSTLWMYRTAAKPLRMGSMSCYNEHGRENNHYSVDICVERGVNKRVFGGRPGYKCVSGSESPCPNSSKWVVDGKAVGSNYATIATNAAVSKLTASWLADPAITNIRTSMTKIMGLRGKDLAKGQWVDPKVLLMPCIAFGIGSPWGYPVVP